MNEIDLTTSLRSQSSDKYAGMFGVRIEKPNRIKSEHKIGCYHRRTALPGASEFVYFWKNFYAFFHFTGFSVSFSVTKNKFKSYAIHF
jgi:hypothetical protein